MTKNATNVQDIMKDPSAYYDKPQEVLNDQHLNREDKAEILRCWEEDEKAKLRATSENMPSPDGQQTTGDQLALISNLRNELKDNENA